MVGVAAPVAKERDFVTTLLIDIFGIPIDDTVGVVPIGIVSVSVSGWGEAEQSEGSMDHAVVADGATEAIVTAPDGVCFNIDAVVVPVQCVSVGEGGDDLFFPCGAVVVGDDIEHLGAIASEHDDHIVAI